MLRVLKNEILKSITISKLIAYITSLLILITIIGIIVNTHMLKEVSGLPYINFLKVNLTFILMRPLIPVILVTITAATIAKDYSMGAMKFSLISDLKRRDIILGKLVYIVLLTILSVLVVFILQSIIGGIIVGEYDGIFSNEYFNICIGYLMSAVGMIPMVLLTTLIALIINDFQKTLGTSLGVLVVSLTLDGMLTNYKGITPTGGISYSYMITQNVDYKMLILALLSYIVILTLINVFAFNKKDLLL